MFFSLLCFNKVNFTHFEHLQNWRCGHSGHKSISAGETARCCGSGDMSHQMEEGTPGGPRSDWNIKCSFLLS